ncbi:hypothetical protein IFM89_008871 [Coptis chinensis]|uniref:Uncharacterized protein n=1 Tax=Coptis chinensis TaxID=261450 RepID=A0A835H9S0_9MAGN|nr:hypothetical protein IFM89_008871 [Coptis chinensis]
MTDEQRSVERERYHEYYRCRKNALTGDRIQHDHGTPQKGPTNIKGPSQLHSQREYIPGVTVVGYDVDVNHLLSLLRQHIESEFSRFTAFPSDEPGEKDITFKRVLLNNCQEAFEEKTLGLRPGATASMRVNYGTGVDAIGGLSPRGFPNRPGAGGIMP